MRPVPSACTLVQRVEGDIGGDARRALRPVNSSITATLFALLLAAGERGRLERRHLLPELRVELRFELGDTRFEHLRFGGLTCLLQRELVNRENFRLKFG